MPTISSMSCLEACVSKTAETSRPSLVLALSCKHVSEQDAVYADRHACQEQSKRMHVLHHIEDPALEFGDQIPQQAVLLVGLVPAAMRRYHLNTKVRSAMRGCAT